MISKENNYFSNFCPPLEFSFNSSSVLHLIMNNSNENVINDISGNENHATIIMMLNGKLITLLVVKKHLVVLMILM